MTLAAVEQHLRRYFTPEDLRALFSLIPPTQRFIDGQLVPRLNKYIPVQPTPKQAAFLSLADKDAFYGGAAGGGKSIALIAAAAQFLDVPGYAALIIRKTFAQLKMPSALMSIADDWWMGMPGVHRKDGGRTWEFETEPGKPVATLTFGYMETTEDRRNYQSSQFHFIGADEVTDFSESDFRFLFSRLRNPPAGIPLRMRCASNPNGPGRLWVKQRYVDPASRGERIFIPAQVDDNYYLAEKDDYKKQLAEELGPIEAAQLLRGDWDAQAAGKFMRHWFKIVPAVPSAGRFVRYWDLAATEAAPGKDPSWTAGVLLGCTGKEYYVQDIRRARLTPQGVEQLILQTAKLDGSGVAIRMEQEPGSAGVRVIDDYRRLLAGYDFKGEKVTGPREIRANGLASQAEGGNVFVVSGNWNKDFLDELEVFPGGGHDDMVVAASGAFNDITGIPPVDGRSLQSIGRERLNRRGGMWDDGGMNDGGYGRRQSYDRGRAGGKWEW